MKKKINKSFLLGRVVLSSGSKDEQSTLPSAHGRGLQVINITMADGR